MPITEVKKNGSPERLPSVPVFFSPEQVAEPQIDSPSASKPGQVVARWQASRHPIDVRATQPVTVDELARAHDRTYIEDVLALRRENGFGNCSVSVARSLPWTNGSMLSAARHAVATGRVACAPCSGFHHAGWDHPRGFCTFNGLMVTALALRTEGLVERIAILDCDQHYGDGTHEIIDRLDAYDWIFHVTAGHGYSMHAGRFLAALPAIVESLIGCDLVLYQAGADPHIDDPLGGFLDDAQLAQRDAIVFDTARNAGLPVAWNLAGGYQDPVSKVLDIHDRTMEACAAAYC